MRRTLFFLPCVSVFLSAPISSAQTPPLTGITLTRLHCGDSGVTDISNFSDTHAFDGQSLELTSSCYLIKHGEQLLIWDAGLATDAMDGSGHPYVKKSLVDQLATLGLRSDQITHLGISHSHGDHTGQAASFPKATLLIGKADWMELKQAAIDSPAEDALAPWTTGIGTVEQVEGDKDIFGDGTVVMLSTPGHTQGHHSLLVMLKRTGAVLLTGDLAIFREGYRQNEVPDFNVDRAATLGSLDRIKRLATNLRARVIVQHDPRDIGKLPPFPRAAD